MKPASCTTKPHRAPCPPDRWNKDFPPTNGDQVLRLQAFGAAAALALWPGVPPRNANPTLYSPTGLAAGHSPD